MRHITHGIIALASFATSMAASRAPAALAAQSALLDEVEAEVGSMEKLTQVMVDKIFSFSELGQQEIETSAYVTGILEQHGWRIERAPAGIPTAWFARWGSGSPVISFGSDIDGIPKANQKPGVAWHEPLVPGAPGHGEGHNSGQAVNVTAFVALAIAGGIFAVSIPTNTVIGMRLTRDNRASAMGIAVGVLMGSQALGAAVGGLLASQVGSAQAITGALVATTVFGLWSAASTPHEAKHLKRARRRTPAAPRRPGVDTVVDLVSLEAADRPPAGIS
jgi:hypothetical protein